MVVDYSLFAFLYLIFFFKHKVDRRTLVAIVLGTFAISILFFFSMNRVFESVRPEYSNSYIFVHSLVKALLPIFGWLLPNFLFNMDPLKRSGQFPL